MKDNNETNCGHCTAYRTCGWSYVPPNTIIGKAELTNEPCQRYRQRDYYTTGDMDSAGVMALLEAVIRGAAKDYRSAFVRKLTIEADLKLHGGKGTLRKRELKSAETAMKLAAELLPAWGAEKIRDSVLNEMADMMENRQ